jgi:hypothetical protein
MTRERNQWHFGVCERHALFVTSEHRTDAGPALRLTPLRPELGSEARHVSWDLPRSSTVEAMVVVPGTGWVVALARTPPRRFVEWNYIGTMMLRRINLEQPEASQAFELDEARTGCFAFKLLGAGEKKGSVLVEVCQLHRSDAQIQSRYLIVRMDVRTAAMSIIGQIGR